MTRDTLQLASTFTIHTGGIASLRVNLTHLDCTPASGAGVLTLSHACCTPQPGPNEKLEEALSCCVHPDDQPPLPPPFNASSCDDDVSGFFNTLAKLHSKVAADAKRSRDLAAEAVARRRAEVHGD